jgi:hypothetical protein
MAKFAIVQENKVTNIIVAEDKETAEKVTNATCIEYTDSDLVGIDYLWDGEKFTAPDTPVVEGEVVND